MRLCLTLIASLLVMPAGARTPQQVSVWGQSSMDFMGSFNTASAAAGFRLQINSLSCRLGARFECDTDVSGLRLTLSGQGEPEAVHQVRIGFQANTPVSMVAAASHIVMQIAQPNAPIADRRAAVTAVLGIGAAAPSDRAQVEQTQVLFRERWRGGEVVFQQAP